MSEAERFGLDTNVLVYAVDSRDAARHRRAQLVIERARLRFCLLTVQSLGEFYAVTTRKGLLTRQEAAAILRGWMAMFPVVAADAEAAETALTAAEAGRFSYWDALLLATLARHGCTAVLSEDMADGAELAGITVRDPFAGAALPPAVDGCSVPEPAPDYAGLLRLDGRVALVTGAGAGIGRATALALAQAGALVAVTDLDLEAARGVAAEAGQGLALCLDVAVEAQVQATVAAVAGQFGRIDILVNNAGLGARMPTVELPLERWERAMAVGATGQLFVRREAGRHMLRAGSGAVVNVASIMGVAGGRHYANLAYHAAKGAVVNMTRALALEWAASGIRVNAVAPTFVRTRLIEPLLAEPGMAERLLADTPLGRLATPEEVAAAVLFLCSDMAAMITGVVLPVDGGWLAY